MIEIPAKLAAKLKSNDLRGIKVFVYLYRNRWDEANGAFSVEQEPIDISDMIVKCGTLSTGLDVGEISEYTASNVTVTLADPKNRLVEGVVGSYFPAGYQIYGSRMELCVGASADNLTKLFTGAIRSLPNYKPEKYQLDVTLVSELELFKDVEAKNFSNKYTGEQLVLDHHEQGQNPFYHTASTGVGGVEAVYANGVKLYEGVDYEISHLNSLSLPALIEITKEALFGQTITADYYTWKRNLQVHDIVNGLLDAAKWNPDARDVQQVAWNSLVRSYEQINSVRMGIGYFREEDSFKFNWLQTRDGVWANTTAMGEQTFVRRSILPKNFETQFTLRLDMSGGTNGFNASYGLGDALTSSTYYRLLNGILLACQRRDNFNHSVQITIGQVTGGSITSWAFQTPVYQNVSYLETPVKIRKIGSLWEIYLNNNLAASFTCAIEVQYETMYGSKIQRWSNLGQTWRILDDNGNYLTPPLQNPCLVSDVLEKPEQALWGAVNATLNESNATYSLRVFLAGNDKNFNDGQRYDLGVVIGETAPYLYCVLGVSSGPDAGFNVSNWSVYRLTSSISFELVNLGGRSVLEALEDLALISGYEFGINRNGVFFFRPRQTSTAPVYVLDKNELIKIDTVTQDVRTLFTKLTLSFGEMPLEFYANTGDKPTPMDRYGVINRNIEKPDLINYDNPELAQAIGPQLLDIYSALPRKITCTAKINLVLELGDIVNLKRDMPLTVPPQFSDHTKYEKLNTFYRACKIIGLNYDFEKRQVKYTLRDVSNKNTEPVLDFYQYQTIFPTPLDYKE